MRLFIITLLFSLSALAGISLIPPGGGGGGGGDLWSDPVDSNITFDTNGTYSFGTGTGDAANRVWANSVRLGATFDGFIEMLDSGGTTHGTIAADVSSTIALQIANDGNQGKINIIGSFASSGPAEGVEISTAGGSGAFSIKDIFIHTDANAGAGNGGDIIFDIATAGGTQGVYKFLRQGDAPSVSDVWTASNADGTGYWAAPAAGGATTALDNLASVAIGGVALDGTGNVVPDVTNVSTLGSASKDYTHVYTRNITAAGSTLIIINDGMVPISDTPTMGTTANRWSVVHSKTNTIRPNGTNSTLINGTDDGGAQVFDLRIEPGAGVMPNATIDDWIIGSVRGGGDIGFYTVNSGVADANATGDIFVETGNKTAGTGDSGTYFYTAGSSTGGERGQYSIDSALLTLTSGMKPAAVTGDPCGDTTNYPEGTSFYNDTSNYYCYCDGTNDVQMHSPATACF